MDINYIPLDQNNPEQFAIFCELLTEYDAEIDHKPLAEQNKERIKRIAMYIFKSAEREDSWLELLYVKSNLIGFLFYEVDDGSYGAPETLGYGFIREFYIRPEYRRHGLGSICFEKIENTFRKRCVKQMWLTCETEAGAPFWRSLGFLNTEKRCQKNDIDIYVKPIGFTRAEKELSHFGVRFSEIQELQDKDGVYVYRIKGETPYVLKCFENAEHKREIEYYRLLQSLGIKTVKVIDSNENALLMEDISESKTHRLAAKGDMEDPDIMRVLAKWYSELHTKGRPYVRDFGAKLYCETDDITPENLRMVKEKTQTANDPVWALIEEHYGKLRELIDDTPKTLTYNDFYYTNMVVAKDKSEAYMFDYNFLGKGFPCADLINVTYDLSDSAKTAFLKEYGVYDSKEMSLAQITGILFTLIFACKRREVMPDWAKQELKKLTDGDLYSLLKTFLILIQVQ